MEETIYTPELIMTIAEMLDSNDEESIALALKILRDACEKESTLKTLI